MDGTVFQTKFESYQFNVMRFGPCNAPAMFQRTMDMIFDRCRSFASIYLDYLSIHYKTTQEHLLHLRQVFSILRAERFYAKPSKCQFFASELEFVGFVVSAKGISPQESKLKVVREWPTPTSAKDIRILFGNLWFLPAFCSKLQHVGGPPNGSFEKRGGMVMEYPPGTVLPKA